MGSTKDASTASRMSGFAISLAKPFIGVASWLRQSNTAKAKQEEADDEHSQPQYFTLQSHLEEGRGLDDPFNFRATESTTKQPRGRRSCFPTKWLWGTGYSVLKSQTGWLEYLTSFMPTIGRRSHAGFENSDKEIWNADLWEEPGSSDSDELASHRTSAETSTVDNTSHQSSRDQGIKLHTTLTAAKRAAAASSQEGDLSLARRGDMTDSEKESAPSLPEVDPKRNERSRVSIKDCSRQP